MKKLISIILFTSLINTAEAESAKEFLEKALVGAGIDQMTRVTGARISCDSIELSYNHGLAPLPHDDVITPVKRVEADDGFGRVKFDCINGGACLNFSYGRNSLSLTGITRKLSNSLTHAFQVLQQDCGGKETSSF